MPSALAVRHVASVAVDGVVAVMAVAVEVEHPVTSQPAAANGLNLRLAWKPVNGHGAASYVQHGAVQLSSDP